MLGAMSDHLPFPAEVLRDAVEARFAQRKPGKRDVNLRAFDAGRERAAALVV
jgi:indolepyruvate ferredoxin oxidoreductase beta subunit